jgi:hypothetical protein
MIRYFKALKTVPQAVPQSMCNEVASARAFGTADFYRSEAIVLWSNRATLPLVTATLILGHVQDLLARLAQFGVPNIAQGIAEQVKAQHR